MLFSFSSYDLNLPHLIRSLSLVAASVFLASAFNIDEEFPIIITNKFNGQNGHFGASVLLLPNNSPKQHETDVTGWVLIGVPKANCTFHANHSSIYEPGIIWRCSLGPINPARRKICEVVEMDPTGEYDPYDRKLPFTDRKDGGWLGGSMFVGDSDRFVTCASRWVNKKYKSLYLVNGICYWLPKSNLMVEDTSDPNWPWVAPKLSYRLSPLLNGTKQTLKTIVNNSASQQVDKTVTYDWAYGQFGFSLHLTSSNELVVGSVGVLDWTGSLVYYRDTLSPRSRFHRYNAHAGSPAFSEVVVVSPQYHSDLLQTADYFGYSITSGKFFHAGVAKNKTQFAAGAPRSSHLSGKVLVFTVKELQNGKSEGMLEIIVEPIEGRETKKGNHYGSYFGQSLLALDGNNDGFDELFVGAPLYGAAVRTKRNVESPVEEEEGAQEEEEEKTAKMKSGDEGCVFVYWSTGYDFVRDPQVLCGDKVAGSRFGTAITSLKDINHDGFNDVAIGAPYENEGRGAVYIYHGGEHMSLAQKLQPASVDPKIRTFGWSLSLGVDIDENGYPDLAVGAYETNQVVIYRTIPIVKFEAGLAASIPKLLSTTGEFNLTTCLSYNGHGRMQAGLGIWIKLTVLVEPEGKRLVSLIHGAAWSPERSAALLVTSLKKLLFFRKDELSCYNFTAVRNGSVDGITRTVPILMEYWMEEHGAVQGAVMPVHYVIEKHSEANPSPFINLTSSKSNFSDFSHKLPLPVGNTFGTEKLTLPVGTICEADGDPECLANLTLNAILVDQKTGQIFGNHNPFVLGTTQMLTLIVELSNHRETANLPITLSIHLPQPLNIRRLPNNCDQVRGSYYSCSVRRPIKEMQKETLAIELDMSNVYGGPVDNSLDIKLEANTSSLLVQDCKHQLSIIMITQLQPQNFSHVDSKIEYAPGNDSIPTFGISQAFEVGLMGPSTAAAMRVDFDIPRKIEINGKMLELIGLKRPIVAYDGEVSCYPVNGSFLHERQNETPTISTFTPPVEILMTNLDHQEEYVNDDDLSPQMDYFNNDEDDSSTVSEVAKILLGKTRRGKRSIKDDNELDQNGEIVRISCGNIQKRPVVCLRISCIFSHFTPQKKAVIELKLKMYNKVASLLLNSESQFHIEDISSLRIGSVGSVQVLDSRGNPFGQEGKVEFVSRLDIPPPYELPAWILIVSVAGGLLTLLFIMLILKKCGFFRRHKREELMHHRKILEMRIQAAQSINNPGSSSTARIQTSSSQQNHTSNAKQRHSLRKGNEVTNSTKRKNSQIRGQGAVRSLATSSHHSLSPATLAKQRDGAVDLNELRRLYADEDHNDNDLYF